MLKALSVVGAVAVAAVLLIPTVSLASPVSEDQAQSRSATVSFGDLNLGSQTGVDRLQTRIHGAARQVCGISAPAPLTEIKFNRDCYKGAVASAQPGFDEAVAAARHGVVLVGAGASLIVSAPRQ
jgi:UrcA family protein